MKNQIKLLLLALTLLIGGIANATTYYVATNGNNSSAGTITAPFATIEKLNSVLKPGDIAYIRGGTYRSTYGNGGWQHFTLSNLHGASGNTIKIWAYPGEYPIFNLDNIAPSASDPTAMVIDNCSYIHLKGIRVTGLNQISSGAGVSRGIDLRNSPNNTIEFVELDHIGGYGFILGNGSNDNYFLNCDAHHMDDRLTVGGAWGNANGFQCTGGSNATRNTFDGCRAWWISDDGFDFYGTDGVNTLKNCWAFWNGYEPGTFTARGDGNGFKLGPAATNQHNSILRTVTNCLSFENLSNGFDQNNGDMRVKLYNNTSYKNGDYGYMWDFISPAPAQDFKNNVSFSDRVVRRGAETDGSNNSWNGAVSVTAADFLSTSSVGVDGPRQADGSLPNLNFLRLTASSDLINAGINVGLAFLSTAPDMGALESTGIISNTPPTANAGVDKTITLPTSSVSLTGSGTDVGGSITAYAWTKLSGPTAGTIASPTAATTNITGLTAGVYQFQLKVTDNGSLTATDVVQVTVNAAGNQAPTANAGADKTITLPTSSVSLAGTGTDADGTIASYAWTKISGPTSGTITTATAASTTFTGLAAGVYKLELKVTDNGSAVGRDTVTVTVNTATSTTLKVIRVNIYGSSITYNNTKWNNWSPVAGTSSAAFKYQDGTASAVKAVFSAQSKIQNNGSTYASTATICPAAVLRYASANTGSRTLTMTGLDPAKMYSFEFYGSASAASGSQTQYVINSWPYPINTYNNLTSYAEFINVYPTSTGTVVLTLNTSKGTYNYINALTIIEQTGSVTSVPATARAAASAGDTETTATTASTSVTVFPLPFASSFTVSLNDEATGTYKLALVNISGKTVWTKAINKQSSSAVTENIYMGNLPNGAYILQVTDPQQNVTTQTLLKN